MFIRKDLLHQHCVELLRNQVLELRSSLSGASDGFEGSSSAGDKHNTEAAMLHLEQEKKAQRLSYAIKNLALLEQLNPEQKLELICPGALAKTNKGLFYFAGPIGKVLVDQQEIMVLSVASPIGRVLSKMKVGESVCFNNDLWVIEEVV